MKTVLESIRNNRNRKFPREELQQLMDNKEEATPYLLDTIREATERPALYLEDASRMDHIYALYLLAQFRETRLYPLLFPFLHLPFDELDDLLGDVLTDGLGRIIASVYTGDPAPIRQLIENEQLNEFVRGAGLDAMSVLALQGQLDRAEVVGYLRDLLQKSSEEHMTFNAMLVHRLRDLYGKEAYDVIKDAYEAAKVDISFIRLDNVDSWLEKPMEDVLQAKRTLDEHRYMEDTIKELQGWACFEQERKQEPIRTKARKGDLPRFSLLQPVVKENKVGRNDPCPCGSGKKYKKCCGA